MSEAERQLPAEVEQEAAAFQAPETGQVETEEAAPPLPEDIKDQPELADETEKTESDQEKLAAKQKEIRERLFGETIDKLFDRFAELLDQEPQSNSAFYHEGKDISGQPFKLEMGDGQPSLNLDPKLVKEAFKAFWHNQENRQAFTDLIKDGIKLAAKFNALMDWASESQARQELGMEPSTDAQPPEGFELAPEAAVDAAQPGLETESTADQPAERGEAPSAGQAA